MTAAKKNSLAEWANRHSLAACFVVVALYIVFRRSTYFIFRSVLPQSAAVMVVYELIDVIWPFMMVAAFGRLTIYRKGRFFPTLLMGVGLILYGLIPFVLNLLALAEEPGLVWQSPLLMLWGIATELFVGFREESVFRGITVNLFADKYLKDRRGILLTAFGASFFFGVMHMQNIALGQTVLGSAIQSVNAFFLGLVFAAVYLRGANIWALMLIHAFIDLGVSVKELLTETYAADALSAMAASNMETSIDAGTLIPMLILWLIYTVIALFLLRKRKCAQILERVQHTAPAGRVNG